MANSDPNSIVDYLSGQGKASDFNSRTALAKQYGINDYAGTAEQNTTLLSKLKGSTSAPVVPKTPAEVTNLNDANSFINAGQPQDFQNASATSEPATRTSLSSYKDIYDNITASLTKNLPEKPVAKDLSGTYTNLRNTYGVTDLESQLTDLQKQARDLEAATKARTDAEKGKTVPLNVIAGRISEEERQGNERLAAINSSIQSITSQLQTKYSIVDNIMKYTQQDYSNAVDAYDTQFTQNLNLMNTVKGLVDADKSDKEKAQDNARANLQIIYNNISAGAANVDSLSEAEKANITKLELQAGLPSGFYTTLQSKNPKSDILSTTTRESSGGKYADVILRNSDGSLSTKSIYLGGVDNSSGKQTSAEQLQEARATVAKQLQGRRGGDGYVAPEDYQKARDAWVATGLAADDFDKSFKQYANPDSYDKLGLSY